ncbi:MAG: hypothetical protein EZS28_014846, partial [Streblomastix strix]
MALSVLSTFTRPEQENIVLKTLSGFLDEATQSGRMQSFFSSFTEAVAHVLVAGDDEQRVTMLIQLISKFIVSNNNQNEQKKFSFAESFVAFLCSQASAAHSSVRYHALELIGEILKRLGTEIDYHFTTVDLIQKALLARTSDSKVTVRRMAAFAAHKLQQPHLGLGCPVICSYIKMLQDNE